MIRVFLLIVIIISSGFSAICQDIKFKPAFSAALDITKGPSLLKQCSRGTPNNVSKFWVLSKNDIDTLESNFQKIYSITSECCASSFKIDSLEGFAFQYIGVIIKGRKFIYINACPFSEIEMTKKYVKDFDPIKDPIMVCDGGKSFWGALFDIETKEFSSLSFNGVA